MLLFTIILTIALSVTLLGLLSAKHAVEHRDNVPRRRSSFDWLAAITAVLTLVSVALAWDAIQVANNIANAQGRDDEKQRGILETSTKLLADLKRYDASTSGAVEKSSQALSSINRSDLTSLRIANKQKEIADETNAELINVNRELSKEQRTILALNRIAAQSRAQASQQLRVDKSDFRVSQEQFYLQDRIHKEAIEKENEMPKLYFQLASEFMGQAFAVTNERSPGDTQQQQQLVSSGLPVDSTIANAPAFLLVHNRGRSSIHDPHYIIFTDEDGVKVGGGTGGRACSETNPHRLDCHGPDIAAGGTSPALDFSVYALDTPTKTQFTIIASGSDASGRNYHPKDPVAFQVTVIKAPLLHSN